jgi:hypothetical protein
MLEKGKCPKCKSENIEYDVAVIDMQLFYPFKCKDCGFVGREWYTIKFIGFTDANNYDIDEVSIESFCKRCLDYPKKCKECWYNGTEIDELPITHYFRYFRKREIPDTRKEFRGKCDICGHKENDRWIGHNCEICRKGIIRREKNE